MYLSCAGLSRQQSRYPMSPNDRQMPSSPTGRGAGDPPNDPPRRGSAMSRTADLRSGEGRRPSFGQVTYAELGERRETLSREAAAELRGYSDRCVSVCGRGGGPAPEGTVCLRVGREGAGAPSSTGFGTGCVYGRASLPPCKSDCTVFLWSALAFSQDDSQLYLIMARLCLMSL